MNEPAGFLPYRHCWLCSELFAPYDSIIALTATGTIGPLAFEFLDQWDAISLDYDTDLYGWNGCPVSNTPGEVASAHMYCVKLYLATATFPRGRLHRLWAMMVRRRAWPDCPALMLPPQRDYGRLMARARAFDCFRDMPELPADLDAVIGQHLVAGPLAQLCAVEDIVEQLEGSDSPSRHELDLADIEFWGRGSGPPLVSGPLDGSCDSTGDAAPVFVCIDSKGIRSIQRCPWMNESTRGCYFMVIKEPGQVKADFQAGTCRLSHVDMFTMSNMPQRLNVNEFHTLFQLEPKSMNTLNAVSLASCFGLTFFIAQGVIHSIHAHTRDAPTAEHTFQQWVRCNDANFKVAWVYVPMVSDRLLKLGITFEIRSTGEWSPELGYNLWMEKAGIVNVGLRTAITGTAFFNVEPGGILLLGKTGFYDNAGVLGIFPDVRASCQNWRSESLAPFPNVSECYSSASLEGVTGVWIYRDDKTGFCRGLILDYSNGSQRALGSCRVGVDRARFCADLELIRFARVGRPHDFLKCQVLVDANLPSTHEEWKTWRSLQPHPPETWTGAAAWIASYDWMSWPRGGLLEVWFEHTMMTMSVRGPSESGDLFREVQFDP